MKIPSSPTRSSLRAGLWAMPLVVALLSGCAAAPPSLERLLEPQIAITEARRAGAGESQGSSRHLRLAERQVVEARWLLGNGHGDRAAGLLARATADAHLAAAMGRMEAARRDANGEWRFVDDLILRRQAR